MGLYNVIRECSFMSDGMAVHYPRPTTTPVEIADDEAGPLVEAGSLVPFAVLDDVVRTVQDLTGDVLPAEPDPEPPAKRRPRSTED